MNKTKANLLYFLGVVLFSILISLPLILPYLKAGYFTTHDGEWAVIRLVDMFRIIRDGQFPARMSGALNFGYGYPLFNFAYPFPYYLGLPIYFIVGSFVESIKIIFIGSVFFSAFFFFLASNTLWKNRWSASLSTIIYLYLPYRIVDLYVRGSIGESIALALFPFIFYLTLKLFDSPFSRILVTFLSLSIGALIVTHNIMAVLFLPILIVFTLARIFIEKRWDVLQTFLLSFFLGLGLSAFFWMPALFEKNNILLSKIPIADRNSNFVQLFQLINPVWGYGTAGSKDGFSYQLGIPQFIILIASFLLVGCSYLKRKALQTPVYKYATILVLISLVLLTLLFSFTSFVWKFVPLLKEINYPWTLLGPLGFIISIMAGFVVLENRILKYIILVLSLLAILLVYPHSKPVEYVNRGEVFYLTNEATTTSSHELMPLWVKKIPDTHFKDKVEVISGDAQIKNLTYTSKKVTFNYSATQDSTLRINTIFYPGWRAYVDLDEAKISYNNDFGVMEIAAPANKSRVSFTYGETLFEYLSDAVTILSLLAIIFIFLRPILKFK